MLGFQNPAHIQRWYKLLERAEIRYFLLLAPRYHAKTTCISVNYPVWLLTRDSATRIIIVSKTQSVAESFLKEVKWQLERLGLKPQLGDEPWGRSEITIRRLRVCKDASVVALGVGSQIIGRHADIIIADDIISEEDAQSERQREKISVWFRKQLMPCRAPSGRVIVAGTRWHYADFYSELLRSKEWHHHVDQAIQSDGSALWSELWPLERLEEMKRMIGSIQFNCQFQNDSSGLEGALFKREWLHYYDHESSELKTIWGCDLAISDRPDADYFVCAEVGYDSASKMLYLLRYHQAHLSFNSQVEYLKNAYRASIRKPLRIIIEANAYQQALPQTLRLEGLPVLPHQVVRDKITRLTALSVYFENETILVRREHEEFIDEFIQFPLAEHDDILDATELACNDILKHIQHTQNPYQPQVILAPSHLPANWDEPGSKDSRPRKLTDMCNYCGSYAHPERICPKLRERAPQTLASVSVLEDPRSQNLSVD